MSKIVAFSGSVSKPSKTTALIDTIAHQAGHQYGVSVQHYDMSDLGVSLGLAQRASDLAPEAQAIINELATADALVIGSPVYKGSYPGLFKHFIDLIDPELLYGKPVLLAASGGGDRHALMVEHQLRPLFGFFMAHSLPTAIYASARDFDHDNIIVSTDLLARIDKAVSQLAPFLQHNNRLHSNEIRAVTGEAPSLIAANA